MDYFDYDLNIYQKELLREVEAPTLSGQTLTKLESYYSDEWYLDIYICQNGCTDPAPNVEQPIQFTAEEATKLGLGKDYFADVENWYGLDGFLKDYEHQISDRLWEIFNALPMYKEDN